MCIISCRARSLEASPRREENSIFFSLLVVFASSVHPLVCVSCCVRLPPSHYYLVSFFFLFFFVSFSSLFFSRLPSSLVCAADYFLCFSVPSVLAPRIPSYFIPHSHLFFFANCSLLLDSSPNNAVNHFLSLGFFYKTAILDFDHLKTGSKIQNWN